MSLVVAGFGIGTSPAAAASTLSVRATPGMTSTQWSGTAKPGNNAANLVWTQTGITDPTGMCTPSDHTFSVQHPLTISYPRTIAAPYETDVRIVLRWSTGLGGTLTDDLNLFVYGPNGKLAGYTSGSLAGEAVNITDRVSGRYTVVVCTDQNGPAGTPFTVTATAWTYRPDSVVRSTTTQPSYAQFEAPAGIADDAGEPSIGNNWLTGHTLFTSNIHEYRIGFNLPARTSTWTLVNTQPNTSNQQSLDPIGWTDHTTGRTIISQLLLACSGAAYSDDDFATTPSLSEGCGTGLNGFDHQTVGGGPYPAGMHGSYPHAVYYCSQAPALLIPTAYCSRSDDGGRIFGTPVEIFHGRCQSLHGHVQVGPDGTVYVPDAECGLRQGVAVSRDAGKTWTVREVPNSFAGTSDPTVSIGSDNTLYFAYADGRGEARLAISRDHGATWIKNLNVGSLAGVHNVEFAQVVAGDGNRAAVAFIGTPTRGFYQGPQFGKSANGSTFTGADWRLYVATTFNRGNTWALAKGLPTDPVQRGCVWNGGGSVTCRNLLDFEGITITKTGAVEVAFADGCLPASLMAHQNCSGSNRVSENGYASHGAVLRQIGGLTLFRRYDPR